MCIVVDIVWWEVETCPRETLRIAEEYVREVELRTATMHAEWLDTHAEEVRALQNHVAYLAQQITVRAEPSPCLLLTPLLLASPKVNTQEPKPVNSAIVYSCFLTCLGTSSMNC